MGKKGEVGRKGEVAAGLVELEVEVESACLMVDNDAGELPFPRISSALGGWGAWASVEEER